MTIYLAILNDAQQVLSATALAHREAKLKHKLPKTPRVINSTLSRLVKSGKLIRVARGLYADPAWRNDPEKSSWLVLEK